MNDRTIDTRHMSRECPECGQRFSSDGVFSPFDGVRLERMSVSLSIDPLVGVTIDGRYEVIELLGEGGMGRVYSVLHTSLGRLFALKALRRELARDEELSQRFMREAKAMASVRHPHVVEITDFGRLPDGVPYFVMEMLVGETLAQVIKNQGYVSAARGVPILEQVASALAAAHEAGVVHRDLKPENVFLVGSGTGREGRADDVRVVDFGAAKIIGSSQVTRNGVVFGTPYYMSPEQASGSQVDTRTDVYSLGVIMYEMFTGKVPFEGDTYMNVLTQHMFVEPDPPSLRSPVGATLGALDQVTLVCMAKNPDKRFASMDEVLGALTAARTGQEVHPSLAPARAIGGGGGFGYDNPPGPSLEDIRRAVEESGLAAPRPWGWIAVAAIGIGAALGAIVWVYLHRPEPESEAASVTATQTMQLPAPQPALAAASSPGPAVPEPTAALPSPAISSALEPAQPPPARAHSPRPEPPHARSTPAASPVDDEDPFRRR
jgi:serine/threonine-protein kinase